MSSNDRFSAKLRQHLIQTADERPAEGQLADVLRGVAATRQQHPLAARLTWFPGRIGPFPAAALRFGLVAVVLALATVAVAVFIAGGKDPSASTMFEGTWISTDPLDESRQTLVVGRGTSPTVQYEDVFASGGVCDLQDSKHFTTDGVGEVSGARLDVSYPNGGSCGLTKVAYPISGVHYDHDADTDTLVDYEGTRWVRVRGGDGPPPTLPPGPSPTSGTVFEGRWTAIDPADGSTLTLVVGEGMEPVLLFQDDHATGAACVADEVKVFRADGVGEIRGSRLIASYPDGGGCGSMVVEIGGRYDHDAGSDTLLDRDGVTWNRVPEGEPAPTLRPAPTAGGCIDLAQGGTYTASVSSLSGPGPVSLTATVPGTPAVAWQGSRFTFVLSGSCQEPRPIAFFASTATTVNDDRSCIPSSREITDFADAIARLDTPKGDDISDRIDLTIDGHPAARYDVSNLSTCRGFGLWGGSIIGDGETGSLYVIDVDGVLVAIELNRNGRQTEAELDEAHTIIESLQIEP